MVPGWNLKIGQTHCLHRHTLFEHVASEAGVSESSPTWLGRDHLGEVDLGSFGQVVLLLVRDQLEDRDQLVCGVVRKLERSGEPAFQTGLLAISSPISVG